jgi:branched-chain amino acid transport system ATP-binding protein
MELLEIVGLTQYAQAPAAILSYGQRKLLAIAASMMSAPRIIILDEPVAGVNPTMIRRITEVIKRLNAEGTTLIIIEHNMDFVMSLCSRLIVLEGGRKIADAAPPAVRADPRVLQAYLGRAHGAAQPDGR